MNSSRASTNSRLKAETDLLEVTAGEVGRQESFPNENSLLREEETALYDRKMLLKLDLILVPMMSMLYLLAFLDRANVGNARVVSSFTSRTASVTAAADLIFMLGWTPGGSQVDRPQISDW